MSPLQEMSGLYRISFVKVAISTVKVTLLNINGQ